MSRKNGILGLSEPTKSKNFLIFLYLWAFEIKFMLSWVELSMKNFYNLGAWCSKTASQVSLNMYANEGNIKEV